MVRVARAVPKSQHSVIWSKIIQLVTVFFLSFIWARLFSDRNLTTNACGNFSRRLQLKFVLTASTHQRNYKTKKKNRNSQILSN